MPNHRAELSEFLRSRRARLRPGEAGLPVFGGRRRVSGLRREELAALAGISVDYYVRLEQGRLQNVSESILEAVARALRLDEAERTHLYNIAKPARRAERARPQSVRASQQWLLDALPAAPAYILGRRLDLVAWNDMAGALLAVDLAALPADRRNMARLVFLNDNAHGLWVDWERKAQETVGGLRMQAGAHPDDPILANLIGELSVKSDRFRQMWAEQAVWATPNGTMHLAHPIVGELALAYEALAVPDRPDQLIIVYTAQPGSPSEERLRRLSNWNADSRPAATPHPIPDLQQGCHHGDLV